MCPSAPGPVREVFLFIRRLFETHQRSFFLAKCDMDEVTPLLGFLPQFWLQRHKLPMRRVLHQQVLHLLIVLIVGLENNRMIGRVMFLILWWDLPVCWWHQIRVQFDCFSNCWKQLVGSILTKAQIWISDFNLIIIVNYVGSCLSHLTFILSSVVVTWLTDHTLLYLHHSLVLSLFVTRN